jgi:hypothetical protein
VLAFARRRHMDSPFVPRPYIESFVVNRLFAWTLAVELRYLVALVLHNYKVSAYACLGAIYSDRIVIHRLTYSTLPSRLKRRLGYAAAT